MPRRIAVVHDWLYAYAGAERVLEQILECYPDAEVFSLLDFVPSEQRAFLKGKPVRTSFLQHAPFAKRFYQKYLPLMPAAVEAFDLRAYQLVISTSSAVAKGVLTDPNQLHVCYLQARNLRYLYEERFVYHPGSWLVPLQEIVLSRIRVWDAIAAQRPDVNIANSQFVRRWHLHRHRIEAMVLYPPVDCAAFAEEHSGARGDYFVTVGRLEKYKQFRLIVEAFNRIGMRLIVIGDGSQYAALKRLAKGNIEFTGMLPAHEVAKIVARAMAMIYCAREDFGIAPVEAQAAGIPVIAFAEGGAAETVRGLEHSEPTGVLFRQQSTDAIVEAIRTFQGAAERFCDRACQDNARRFSIDRFRLEFRTTIEHLWNEFLVTRDSSKERECTFS